MSNQVPDGSSRRSGRRPGASTTRAAILSAASHQFARRGYARASLRVIAAEAGVDQKLIAYFFGSKQRLFIAAVGLPLNPAEVLPLVLAGDPETVGERLQDVLVQILSQPELHERLTGFVRAVAADPEIARMMREFLHAEVFEPVARALGGGDAVLRLNLFGSQIVGLMMARYVLEVQPLASLPPAEVAAAVAPTLERYLIGELATGAS